MTMIWMSRSSTCGTTSAIDGRESTDDPSRQGPANANSRASRLGVMRERAVRVMGRNERRTPMERDVVCDMQVDPTKAAGTSEYNGKTYYFCSKGCKTKFDANPAQYAK